MAEQVLQLYEAMFLVDPGIATDWEAAKGMVETIMVRAKAQSLVCRLWDERRLAYPINKQKRAAYILCYFRANGSAISGIERDTQLSEHLLRVLVLRADHITDEELEQIKDTPDRRLQPAAPRPSVSAQPDRESQKIDETDSSDFKSDDENTLEGQDLDDNNSDNDDLGKENNEDEKEGKEDKEDKEDKEGEDQ